MGNNVRSYTTKQLLDRVAQLDDFKYYPSGYWMIAVRSNEDAYNTFDDKLYLFKGKESVAVWKGTTNPGSTGLKQYYTYSSAGAAILKSNEIVYDSHARGLHKGKVLAYRQVKPYPYFRDKDKDNKAEENGKEYLGIVYANIHPASYIKGNKEMKKYIGPWSLGCIVFARRSDFDLFMGITKNQSKLTLCILKEFDPGKPLKKTAVAKPKAVQPTVISPSPVALDNEPSEPNVEESKLDSFETEEIPIFDDEITVDEIEPDGLESIIEERVEDSANDKIKELTKQVNNFTSNLNTQVQQVPNNSLTRKETPSWKTSLFLLISTISGGGLVAKTATEPAGIVQTSPYYIYALLLAGLVIILIGVINYRISAKQSQNLNETKLQLHSNRNLDNIDLIDK